MLPSVLHVLIWISLPADVESAIGKNPSEATAAVAKTGRNRAAVPFKIRWVTSFSPSSRNLLKYAINTIPFNTATPNKAIKPIPALILKFIPRIHIPTTPPIAASGMAEKIIRLSAMLLKLINNNRNISNNATGTAMNKRAFARRTRRSRGQPDSAPWPRKLSHLKKRSSGSNRSSN